MATEKQIAANQSNAQHSQGPITPEGKAAVSQNRTVHGLNYNPETFRVLSCESQSEYDALLNQLEKEQRPADLVEKLIVISMAQHRWLLTRANRLQETCFDQETAQITDTKLFSLYLRYATANERAFHKCLADLLKLRADREKFRIGFESELRRVDRHDSWKTYDLMEVTMKQLQVGRLQSDILRDKRADDKAAKAEQAA